MAKDLWQRASKGAAAVRLMRDLVGRARIGGAKSL
jgi:hypothetical protein